MQTTNPLLHRRLQARTCLVVEMYEPDCQRDYSSYGHEADGTLWWYREGRLGVANGEDYHHQILGDSEADSVAVGDEVAEGYFRGRYCPVNQRISLLPIVDDAGADYDVPRDLFHQLEVRFPDAVDVEVF